MGALSARKRDRRIDQFWYLLGSDRLWKGTLPDTTDRYFSGLHRRSGIQLHRFPHLGIQDKILGK